MGEWVSGSAARDFSPAPSKRPGHVVVRVGGTPSSGNPAVFNPCHMPSTPATAPKPKPGAAHVGSLQARPPSACVGCLEAPVPTEHGGGGRILARKGL
jgi:hypothetical protein